MRNKPAPSLHGECARGLAVGGITGLVSALAGGVPAPWAMLASAGASAVGALIGLLLWSGSDAPSAEPVTPPRKG